MDKKIDSDAEATTPPEGQLVENAYAVLTQAVEAGLDGLRWPTASQVRLAMKQLTYGGFNPKDLGFKRFRDFLQAAETAGHVTLHLEHPGDIVVAAVGATAQRQDGRRPRIRRDLWKAASDWSAEVDHFYDVEADRCLSIPTKPVLLEPTRFQQLRKRIEDDDQNLVKVPRIDIKTQVHWMHMFAEGQDDSSLKLLLTGALGGEKPAKHFAAVLRNQPAAQDRWFDILAANVSASLQAWKDTNENLAALRLESVNQQRTEGDSRSNARHGNTQASANALVEAAGSILALNIRSARDNKHTVRPGGEEQLRALLHRAIDQMPESELRTIRIPVGYLLGE